MQMNQIELVEERKKSWMYQRIDELEKFEHHSRLPLFTKLLNNSAHVHSKQRTKFCDLGGKTVKSYLLSTVNL